MQLQTNQVDQFQKLNKMKRTSLIGDLERVTTPQLIMPAIHLWLRWRARNQAQKYPRLSKMRKIWRINRTLSIDSPSKNIFYPILTNEIRWGASLEKIWSLQPECRTGEVAALIVITPPQVTQETPQVELLQMLNSRLKLYHMSDLQNLIEL